MSTAPTTILLIRHGHTDAIGRRLVGRSAGVHLTQSGRNQAQRLVGRLRGVPIARIYASPLERAMETAEPLAAARGLEVARMEELIEVEFGEWTGFTFAELEARDDWRRFNTHRATAVVPGGEAPPDVRARIVAVMEKLHRAHPGETVVAVTHADVVRAAVLHYVGASLDMVHRVDIMPASITGVLVGDDFARLLYVNHRELTSEP